jgi:hypothetical protein
MVLLLWKPVRHMRTTNTNTNSNCEVRMANCEMRIANCHMRIPNAIANLLITHALPDLYKFEIKLARVFPI